VLELRLPGFDKGAALLRLAEGRRAVLFLGDDAGDIPAFEQVRARRAGGMTAWGVGVLSSGVDGIAEAADVTVADPAGAVAVLRAVAG
jgi:trehalose 6-phosphate phosphatase